MVLHNRMGHLSLLALGHESRFPFRLKARVLAEIKGVQEAWLGKRTCLGFPAATCLDFV